MKKLLLIVSLTFVLLLSACVNIGRVEDSFIDEGYEKSENASDFIGDVLNSFEDEDLTVEAYVYREELKTAIILVFDGSDELETQLDENNTLQGFIADLEEDRVVRGNMLLIPIALSEDDVEEMIRIFNE